MALEVSVKRNQTIGLLGFGLSAWRKTNEGFFGLPIFYGKISQKKPLLCVLTFVFLPLFCVESKRTTYEF